MPGVLAPGKNEAAGLFGFEGAGEAWEGTAFEKIGLWGLEFRAFFRSFWFRAWGFYCKSLELRVRF